MKITFIPGTKQIDGMVECPQPSQKFIPEWYKEIPSKKDLSNVKKCMPFLDSFMNGYIQTTWTDIEISINGNSINCYFSDQVPEIFGFRDRVDLPINNFFYNIEFVWKRPWSPIFPEGYSGLVTHPLNRIDLPFYTLSAIVDFDKLSHTQIGNIPFYIRNGFTGIIPKGTPMFQIIPIKREDWQFEKKHYDENFWESKLIERDNKPEFYKKYIRQTKRFD